MSLEEQKQKVVEKVNKIYQNYGMEVQDMSDDDLSTVYRWYRKNLEALDEDLKRSEIHKVDDGNKDE